MTILAVLAVLAVTAADLWADLTPFLGVLIPFVIALGIHDQAGRWVKRFAPIVLTVALVGVWIVTEPPDEVTVGVVLERAGWYLAEAQALYVVISKAVEVWLGESSLNAVVAPERGLFAPR